MLRINEKTGENYNTPFITHLLGFEGYLTPRYEPKLSTWRDLTVFNYPKLDIQELSIQYPNTPQNNFKIKASEDGYKFYQNDQLTKCDQIEIKRYLLNFKSISAERLIDKQKKIALNKTYAKQKPWFVISISTKNNATTTLKAYKIKLPAGTKNAAGLPLNYDPDRFHGTCFNGEIGVFQYFTFDPLLAPHCF